MKTLQLAMVVMWLAGILTACQVPQATPEKPKAPANTASEPAKGAWEQKWQTALSQAKPEGELLVYTTFAGDPIKRTLGTFFEKYGIKGDAVSVRGPELIQRIQSERGAGVMQADVVIAGGTNLVMYLKPQGYLDRISDALILPEATDPKAWRTGAVPFFDKEGYGISIIATFNRYTLRNTELVKDGDIASYKDLLQPRWKGKIVLNDPTITGAGLSFITGLAAGVWGMDETVGFLRQLVKQEPVLTRDNRQQVEWIARGKYAIGLASQPEMIAEFMKLGAPITQVKVREGGKIGAMSGGLGLLAGRPHPNAGIVFANWMLTKEGQGILASNVGLPAARLDAPREGISPVFFPESDEQFYLETEDTLLLETEMVKKNQEIFAPLLK